MEDFIDVSKKDILEAILPELKEKFEGASKNTDTPVIVDRIEWTGEGIRIWMQEKD